MGRLPQGLVGSAQDEGPPMNDLAKPPSRVRTSPTSRKDTFCYGLLKVSIIK